MKKRRLGSVLGPGGMGKTSLALAVIESPLVQAKYAARGFWVPCVEAFDIGYMSWKIKRPASLPTGSIFSIAKLYRHKVALLRASSPTMQRGEFVPDDGGHC